MLDYVCQPVGGELCTSEETSESCWIEKDKVLEMMTAQRFQAYLDFEGNINYMEYVTKPKFELKMKKTV